MGQEFAPETIYVVDDDTLIQKALARLLEAEEYRVECHCDAESFLKFHKSGAPGCVILDVEMPGMNGYDVHKLLLEGNTKRQVIFLTGHGTIPLSVSAIKSGAVDFLTKPVAADQLLEAVKVALERDRMSRRDTEFRSSFQTRLERLTTRECQVLLHVMEGKMNKQIAADLGVTLKTIKVHRGRAMSKMQANSVADLVRDWTLFSAG